jgi:hypothetical protein
MWFKRACSFWKGERLFWITIPAQESFHPESICQQNAMMDEKNGIEVKSFATLLRSTSLVIIRLLADEKIKFFWTSTTPCILSSQ